MAQEILYYCNLCDEEITTPKFRGKPKGRGLEPDGEGAWKKAKFHDAPIHVCAVCVASIRLLGPMCGQGVVKCKAGPNCELDHELPFE